MLDCFSDEIFDFLSMPRVTLLKYNIIFSHEFLGVADTGKELAHALNCQNGKNAENEGNVLFPSNSTRQDIMTIFLSPNELNTKRKEFERKLKFAPS